jgi:hypothetical protein
MIAPTDSASEDAHIKAHCIDTSLENGVGSGREGLAGGQHRNSGGQGKSGSVGRRNSRGRCGQLLNGLALFLLVDYPGASSFNSEAEADQACQLA